MAWLLATYLPLFDQGLMDDDDDDDGDDYSIMTGAYGHG